RSFARALLETEGFVVLGEAADGGSAVREVRRLDSDVVLLDDVLPDVDGFAVCGALTAAGLRPFVVLTSSRDESSFRRRLPASAACGFIAKSELTGAALQAVIRAAR